MTHPDLHDTIHEAPTSVSLALRALRRHPERVAFQWDGGALTYAGALDLIARQQAALSAAGARRGECMALLSANRAEVWCAGVAAQGLGLAVT